MTASWRAPDDVGGDALALRLAVALEASVEPTEARRRRWLDTLDGRLGAAGLALAVEVGDGAAVARLTRLPHRGRAEVVAPVATLPLRVAELPDGPLRRAVADVAGDATLGVVVEERLRAWPLVLRDARGAVLVRVDVEDVVVPEARKGRREVGLRVRTRAVTRRRASRDHVDEVLRAHGLTPLDAGALAEAHAAIGGAPVDPWRALPLAADLPADVATRATLRRLAEVLRARQGGVLDDVDPEALHDLRVAIRRTRSLVGAAEGVLPRRAAARFADAFREVQRDTGALRDLDVHRGELPAYRALLPADLVDRLDGIADWLAARRAAAWSDVARRLRGKRWRRLLDAWDAFLAAPEAGPKGSDAPIGVVALAQVARLHRRVLKRGRDIDDDAPPAALHALRKRCKRLRYVLEAWREALDPGAVDKVVDDLKGLQTLLGAFQDAEMHAAELDAIAAAMDADGAAAPADVLALATLAARLRDRQAEARAGFAAAWRAFDTDRVARHVAALGARPVG